MEPARLPLVNTSAARPATYARPRIAELAAAGYTPRQIAFRLNTEGVATPTGRGRWYPTTVERHAHPERWAGYMRGYRARANP
jgi:hypothetical protein